MTRNKETFLRVVQTADGVENTLFTTDISALRPSLTEGADGSFTVTLAPVGDAPVLQASVEYFEGRGGWYWHIRYGNGEIADVSESYTRKSSARKAAERMAEKLGVEAVEVS
jgi:uncharacterized protein YegP (UPF0339 family)